MENSISRRNFLQWSAVAAAAAAGLIACSTSDATPENGGSESRAPETLVENGQWLTGACMNNCSCEQSRCLLRVYVEDGVPLKIRTDEEDEDTIEVPQRRACLRGRAKISDMLSPSRIKYPMKRKNWSPENPNGELRGIDEWERITWDEALDIVASEMQKAYDNYGPKSILAAAYSDIGEEYFDPIVCLLNAKGGALHHEIGTVSLGAWPLTELFMVGSLFEAPDALTLEESQLHFHFGNNWAANKAGNTAYQLQHAKEMGGKIIIVDPWLNQTAAALADEWVPIIPGTDTAFCLGMMYHQIENGLYNQEFLDKYCVGFDKDHMPEGIPAEMNFKDYVMGVLDGEAKTPEWAEAICGVPAETIRRLAEEIASTEKIDFFAGQSTTKIPAGEQFAQAFYTLAFMHGTLGTPGNSVGWIGTHEHGYSTTPYCFAGDYSNGAGLNPANPLNPPSIVIPNWGAIEDNESWEKLDYTECWQSILDGEYGRDVWPGGKRPIDIHVIYSGGYENSLNSLPNANAGIKAFRKMDFVWGANPFFDASRQHCDVVLPVCTWWEKGNYAWSVNAESVYWADHVMDPLGESKPEGWIAEELAKRLGLDPKTVNTMTDNERTYYSLAGAIKMTDQATVSYEPLFTLTQEDIDALGVQAEPQQGAITVDEIKEKGVFKMPRSKGDALTYVPFANFIADPENFPVATASGKFEICCGTLAYFVNSMGYSTISPIPMYQIGDPEQGQGTQTEEFPLLLWTPHSLRRAHTVNDCVPSLREAYPQECFISTVDAEARGIKSGDLVLMTSPHGKVLRPAKVLNTIVPGAVALQDGGWIQIDPETGIDLGGDPNILQAPKASGQSSQSWTGTLVQVEKYNGPLTLDPDKYRPVPTPLGVE